MESVVKPRSSPPPLMPINPATDRPNYLKVKSELSKIYLRNDCITQRQLPCNSTEVSAKPHYENFPVYSPYPKHRPTHTTNAKSTRASLQLADKPLRKSTSPANQPVASPHQHDATKMQYPSATSHVGNQNGFRAILPKYPNSTQHRSFYPYPMYPNMLTSPPPDPGYVHSKLWYPNGYPHAQQNDQSMQRPYYAQPTVSPYPNSYAPTTTSTLCSLLKEPPPPYPSIDVEVIPCGQPITVKPSPSPTSGTRTPPEKKKPISALPDQPLKNETRELVSEIKASQVPANVTSNVKVAGKESAQLFNTEKDSLIQSSPSADVSMLSFKLRIICL